MRAPHGTPFALACASFLVLSVACEAPRRPDGESRSPLGAASSAWAEERDRRQLELDAYLADRAQGLQGFLHTPLGHSGFPVIMMRLFPEIFPSIWAPGGDPKLSALGFGADPWVPSSVLPFGFGFSLNEPPIVPFTSVGVQVVNLTCAACHVGRVELEDGTVRMLVGAPNAQLDTSSFFAALEATVDHPEYRRDVFADALARHPLGELYGDPALRGQERLERFLFSFAGGTIVEAVSDGIRRNAAARDRLARISYAATDAPDFHAITPGRADAFGLTMSELVDDATAGNLPRAPTLTDVMSVWRQRDRAISHWGGEMRPGVWPVVAAELAVAGSARIVNVENIDPVTDLIADLPPPPYPFEVEGARADRGRLLFEESCASCHHAGDATVYSVEDVGTDASRAQAFSSYTLARFNAALVDACRSPTLCREDGGDPVTAQNGYVATPLDGVWARAPYLHNGSVPTLRHLLVPSERPAVFERGSARYDRERVGFEWQAPASGTTTYDTTRQGSRNTGHDTPRFLGDVDWAQEPERLADLLEYMKTL